MIEIRIAPTSDLIRYLCLFQRTFDTMRRFVQEQDEDGIVLMAWIADAVHNVPALLWQYNPASVEWAERTTAWVNDFPNVVRECAPPAHILAACDAVFAPESAALELGLADDLRDLDLAPPEKLAAYIDLFYHACLGIRWRQRPRTPWRTKERHWNEQEVSTTLLMGKIAAILADVPGGLTHWHDFDEETFTQAIRTLWKEWPVGFGTRVTTYTFPPASKI